MNKEFKYILTEKLKQKYNNIYIFLDERARRLWAANEALSIGYGGISMVIEATSISSATIHKGIKELKNKKSIDKNRIRKKGGGRKSKASDKLTKELLNLVDPAERGDPESPLKWTSKSVRKLAKELLSKGYDISFRTVSKILDNLGYSLQANKKTNEGSQHKDRDAQFQYINDTVTKAQENGNPTISVDAKKKEKIGNYKNDGKEYSPKGKPVKVNTYDFPDKKLGKVTPYGVYDIGNNEGWVSVGIHSDTAEFAVNTIRCWWLKIGKVIYDKANEIVITADCGGSNGYRVRLWKYELQKLANELNIKIKVRHFPPGTSKWNKIEHRLFSYISKNWRGRPLVSREVVVNTIKSTTTSKGLKVMSVLDENIYEKGRKVSKKIFESLNIAKDNFCPDWNYTISPEII